MAQVQIRDQHGNGVPGIAINLGRRDEPGKRLFTQTVDPSGNTDFEYAAAGIIALNDLPHDQAWMLYVNDVESCNPNWHTIEQKTVNVDSFEHDVLITVQVGSVQPGIPCPVDHDKAQFEAWFNHVKVGDTVTHANMLAMKSALVACGFEWQNMCRGVHPGQPDDPSEWRPRIHQPPFLNGPCSGSTHDVDCGDFDGPWHLTFRY